MKKKKTISTLLILILFFFIGYYSYKIWDWHISNIKTENIKVKASESVSVSNDKEGNDNKEKLKVNFEALKKINNESIGYLKINNTNVDYVVVKHKDNNYYLTHSLDKSYNGAGWIFADCSNRLDETDKNIVIYGHNRRDGSMFGSLKKCMKKEWYKEPKNKNIIFITEKGEYIYEIFSVYEIKAESYYATTEFLSNELYQQYLIKIKDRSDIKFDVDLSVEDKVLTLSTCSDNNKYRQVIHARLLQQ